MDKKSQKEIKDFVIDKISSAHLGNLNGTENIEVNVRVSQKRVSMPPNIMVFQAFAFMAATKLTPAACKVLLLFFSKSGYENYIGMDIVTVSDEIKMTTRSVINALNELEEHLIIIKVQNITDKRRNDYFINPMAAWKGNSFTRKTAVKKIETEGKEQLSIFGMDESEVVYQNLKQ